MMNSRYNLMARRAGAGLFVSCFLAASFAAHPALGQSTPTSDASAPGADDSTPTSDDSARGADDSTPTSDDSAPGADDSTPTSDASAPGADSTSSPANEGVPPDAGEGGEGGGSVAAAERDDVESRLAAQEALAQQQARRIEALEAQLSERPPAASAAKAASNSSATRDAAAPAAASSSSATPDGARIDPVGDLLDPNFPKSAPLFGSKLRFSLGGYVKVDALLDIGGNSNRYQFALAGIPVPSDTNEGYFTLHARESRFNVDFRYVSPGLPFNQAFIEFDFFNSNSNPYFNPPRLRHAYFRYGDFLFGRTWSTLTDLTALPFLIDFAYGDALYGGRTAQVRYETELTSFLKLRVGVEMLEFTGINNPTGLGGTAQPRLPVLGLRLAASGDLGSVALGGSVGELRWDGTNGTGDAYSVQASGLVNARLNLLPEGRAFIGGQAALGLGAGEDVIAFVQQDVNALLRADGSLTSLPSLNFVLSYGHRLTDLFSINGSFAWARIMTDEVLAPETMKAGTILHANVILHPTDFLSFGVEYMFGERQNFSSATGTDHRVQTMAMYSF